MAVAGNGPGAKTQIGESGGGWKHLLAPQQHSSYLVLVTYIYIFIAYNGTLYLYIYIHIQIYTHQPKTIYLSICSTKRYPQNLPRRWRCLPESQGLSLNSGLGMGFVGTRNKMGIPPTMKPWDLEFWCHDVSWGLKLWNKRWIPWNKEEPGKILLDTALRFSTRKLGLHPRKRGKRGGQPVLKIASERRSKSCRHCSSIWKQWNCSALCSSSSSSSSSSPSSSSSSSSSLFWCYFCLLCSFLLLNYHVQTSVFLPFPQYQWACQAGSEGPAAESGQNNGATSSDEWLDIWYPTRWILANFSYWLLLSLLLSLLLFLF